MKRIWLVSLAFVLLLCACGRKTPTETTAPATEAPATIVMQETTAAETTTYEDIKVATPTIAPGVDVQYEVLVLDDEELQDILDAESKKLLDRYIPNISSVSELGGSAEYDVKLRSVYEGGSLLSAVFSGEYAIYYENSEEGGEVLYTVNIDTVTGKILSTADIVDYEKMVAAFADGRFDTVPDFSQYNAAYGIYPYVSIETVAGAPRLGIYVTKSGMYEEVLGYYVSLADAKDFLKVEIEE